MRIYRSLEAVTPTDRVVSIGVFDGVHIGHRALIGRLIAVAQEHRLTPLVLTFRRHPLAILQPPPPPLLTTEEEKIEILEELGVAEVLILDFTEQVARTHYRDFCRKVLKERLKCRVLVAGPDFALGHQREGTLVRLKEVGTELGFDLQVVRLVPSPTGSPVSSRLIRWWLQSGLWEPAVRSLGGSYSIKGRLKKGSGRGRQLGFPTLNLSVPSEKLLPPLGVYGGFAKCQGDVFEAAIYVGRRPTFDEREPVVEAHLLRFSGEATIGEWVSLRLRHFLRPDQKFESVDALVSQMKKDVNQILALLKEGDP